MITHSLSSLEYLLSSKSRPSDEDVIAALLQGPALAQAIGLLMQFALSGDIAARRPKTLQGYRTFLLRFLRWMDREGYPVDDLGAITPEHITGFLRHVAATPLMGHKAGNKASTVHAYGRVLRRLFNFLVEEEGLLDVSPFKAARKRVRLPAVPEPLILPFSQAEIDALIAVCDVGTPIGLRDRAIFELMLGTGLRAQEVCNIRLEDYSMATGELLVRSVKAHGAFRRTALPPRARRTVNTWLTRVRNTLGTPPDELFISLHSGPPAPLKPGGLHAMYQRRGVQAGVTEARCSPHTMRHTAACMMLENGAQIEMIRQILGHMSPAMTRRYTQMRGETLITHSKTYAPQTTVDKRPKREHTSPVQPAACAVKDCPHPRAANGYCFAHAWRVKHWGDPRPDLPIKSRGSRG